MYSDISDEWCSVEDCAVRMNTTESVIKHLVSIRALKATYEQGYLLVQPAILSGAVRA